MTLFHGISTKKSTNQNFDGENQRKIVEKSSCGDNNTITMLVTDVGDEMHWCFCHQHRKTVTIINSTTWRCQQHQCSQQQRFRWQWCWWHRYVVDFMMVTDLRCWCQNYYVYDFFRYVQGSTDRLVGRLTDRLVARTNFPVRGFLVMLVIFSMY